jgi:hypothetical protein
MARKKRKAKPSAKRSATPRRAPDLEGPPPIEATIVTTNAEGPDEEVRTSGEILEGRDRRRAEQEG